MAGIKSRLMSEPRRPLDPSIDPSANTPISSASHEGRAGQPAMFAPKPPEGGETSFVAWGVAGVVILAIVVGLLFATRHKAQAPPNTPQPLAAYAPNLALSQLAMRRVHQPLGWEVDFYRWAHSEHGVVKPSPALPSRCSFAMMKPCRRR